MQILEELEDQSEIKMGIRSNKDKTKRNISFWSWRKGEQTQIREERRKEEEEEEEEEDHMYGYMSWVVWDLLSSVWKSVDFCIIVWICVVLV